ncbi:MAG: hypothetical protein CM15mP83_8960 [Flavobacteriaceae bacterium]|nr:MAG: hypothetical protein CM15mP83_8960 [Flavobacteriaceae bacterium]
MRYAFTDTSSLRFSMGSGRRVATVFAENQKLFGSGRTILIPELKAIIMVYCQSVRGTMVSVI